MVTGSEVEDRYQPRGYGHWRQGYGINSTGATLGNLKRMGYKKVYDLRTKSKRGGGDHLIGADHPEGRVSLTLRAHIPRA